MSTEAADKRDCAASRDTAPARTPSGALSVRHGFHFRQAAARVAVLAAVGCALLMGHASAAAADLKVEVRDVNTDPGWSTLCQRIVNVGVQAMVQHIDNTPQAVLEPEAVSVAEGPYLFTSGGQIYNGVTAFPSFRYAMPVNQSGPQTVGTSKLATVVYAGYGIVFAWDTYFSTVTLHASATFKTTQDMCALSHAVTALGVLGAGLSIGVFFGCPVCATVGGVVSGLLIVGGLIIDMVSKLDPPDLHFAEVAVPEPSPVPPLPPGLSAEQQRLLSEFETQMSTVIGLERAIVISSSREWGAYEGGDAQWFRKQQEAVGEYSRRAAVGYEAAAALVGQIQTATGIVNQPGEFTSEQVHNLETELGEGKSPYAAFLKSVGGSAAEEEGLRSYLASRPLGELVGVPYGSALTYATRGVAQAAADLRGFAEGEEAPVGVSVQTGSATPLYWEAADLTGRVFRNHEDTTSCVFEWGETTAYGHSTPCYPGQVIGAEWEFSPGGGAEAEGTAIELKPHTEYHYRIKATSRMSVSVGADKTFVTLGPSVTIPVKRAPILTGLTLRRRRIFAARRRRKGQRPSFVRIQYWDSERATTTLSLQREEPGVRSRRGCVAKSARGRRCVRYVLVGSLVHRDAIGPNVIKFDGRIDGRPLPRGKYRLMLVAINESHEVSVPAFAVLSVR
jgi:hypothetical protein